MPSVVPFQEGVPAHGLDDDRRAVVEHHQVGLRAREQLRIASVGPEQQDPVAEAVAEYVAVIPVDVVYDEDEIAAVQVFPHGQQIGPYDRPDAVVPFGQRQDAVDDLALASHGWGPCDAARQTVLPLYSVSAHIPFTRHPAKGVALPIERKQAGSISYSALRSQRARFA